jgi:hypothetical protein
LLALATLIVSCQSIGGQDTTYDLAEFSITGASRLSAGIETVSASNHGQFPHTLVITDADGHVIAATDLIQPGETAQLAVDLTEGTYSFTCRIVAQDDQGNLIDHFESGMNAVVSVSA